MTNEEFETQHRAWHAEDDRRHQVWKAEMEHVLARLAWVTKEGFNDTNIKINALVDAQIRMEDEHRKTEELFRRNAEEHRKTEEIVRKTAEAQLKTDEQLRKTDELLRRHLGGKRNGRD